MDSTRAPATLAIAAALLCLGASDGRADQDESKQLGERAGVKVFGEVVDHQSGNPVIGSRVVLAPLAPSMPRLEPRTTDDSGRFVFEEVSRGRYLLTVTAPDYQAMTDSVEVFAAEDLQLVVPLSTDPRALAPRVVGGQAPSALRGFETRRESGRGFFITREEIQSSNARYLTDLLGATPGARVVYMPPAGNTLLLRGDCSPGVWVDGARMRDAPPIDRIASTHSVDAIEIYHGFDLPAEFGVDACGGVLIWTRTGAPPSGVASDASTGDLIRRAAVAVGLVVLAILLIR